MGTSDPTSDKHAQLLELTRKRKATRWEGYTCIGDYHDRKYECDFVSPYTKSAGNVDAEVMILLQDWASEEALSDPVPEDRVRLGYDPWRQTNKRLQSLLRQHFRLELKETYVTNVFPFVKSGSMNASIRSRDLVRAAREFALPQIDIVKPRLAVCLGREAFNAVAKAAGRAPAACLDEAIATPFERGRTQVWCQAHTSSQGTNQRNRGGIKRTAEDWTRMAAALERLRGPSR